MSAISGTPLRSSSSSSSVVGREAGDEQPHALVHLRRRQPDALILAHRLEHVVDELLDARRARSRPASIGRAFARSTGWPIRATFRIAIAALYVVSVMSDAGLSLLPVVRRRARARDAQGRRARAPGLHGLRIRPLSRSEGRGRHDHPHADDERLVLVRRAIEPGYGLWVFPGGYVDRGEQILERPSVRRARNRASTSASTAGEHLLLCRHARRSSSSTPRQCSAASCARDDECLEARTVQRRRDSLGCAGVPQHDRRPARLLREHTVELEPATAPDSRLTWRPIRGARPCYTFSLPANVSWRPAGGRYPIENTV